MIILLCVLNAILAVLFACTLYLFNYTNNRLYDVIKQRDDANSRAKMTEWDNNNFREIITSMDPNMLPDKYYGK